MAEKEKAAQPAVKVNLKISQILNLLNQGKDRKQIGQEFGLNKVQVDMLFNHPKLKGRRVKRNIEPLYTLEDDVAEESKESNATLEDSKGVEDKAGW